MSTDNRRAAGPGATHNRSNSSSKLLGKGSAYTANGGLSTTRTSPGSRPEKKPFGSSGSPLAKENIGSPVNGAASPNVTPRSTARKARAGSASPTPNGLSRGNHTPSKSLDARRRSGTETDSVDGLGVKNISDGRNSRPWKANGTAVSQEAAAFASTGRPPAFNGSVMPENSPMFFHADDVQGVFEAKERPTSIESRSASPEILRPGGTGALRSLSPSERNVTTSPVELKPKFFHVNDAQGPLKLSPGPILGQESNKTNLQNVYQPYAMSSPPRAPSPLREEMKPRKSSGSQSSHIQRTNTSQGDEVITREMRESSASRTSRRSSLNSSTKAASAPRARSPSNRTKRPSPLPGSYQNQSDAVDESSDGHITTSPLRMEATDNPNSTQAGPFSPATPHSPSKSQGTHDLIAELAAQARRERKILDLEISNSSLLAINRTLEREMRKQSSELRRLRRLSRFGRISNTGSSRATSGQYSAAGEDNGLDLDDQSSATESDQDNPEDSHSNISSTMPSSPGSSTKSRTLSARFKDPKPVPLDLSSHRSWLVENQKLNQSIDRCLSAANAMLAGGREALEHKSHADELEKGPKVLSPEETEDNSLIEHGKGLLSPIITPDDGGNPWEQSLNQILDPISSPRRSDQFQKAMSSLPNPKIPGPEDETVPNRPVVGPSPSLGVVSQAIQASREATPESQWQSPAPSKESTPLPADYANHFEADQDGLQVEGDDIDIRPPRTPPPATITFSLPVSPEPQPPLPDSRLSSQTSRSPVYIPPLPDEIDDFEASLDGLDSDEDDQNEQDESTIDPITPSPSSPNPPRQEKTSSRPSSSSQHKPTLSSTSSAQSSFSSSQSHSHSKQESVSMAANAPGNRSSFQKFGSYFGSLSIFGYGATATASSTNPAESAAGTQAVV